MADATVVRGSGEGTALWLLGGLYEIKLTGDVVDEPTRPPRPEIS
jgi:hypothetical protein